VRGKTPPRGRIILSNFHGLRVIKLSRKIVKTVGEINERRGIEADTKKF
jgi:hypothetical protein